MLNTLVPLNKLKNISNTENNGFIDDDIFATTIPLKIVS